MAGTYDELIQKLISKYSEYIKEIYRCQNKIDIDIDFELIKKYHAQMHQAGEAADVLESILLEEIGYDSVQKLHEAARKFAQEC